MPALTIQPDTLWMSRRQINFQRDLSFFFNAFLQTHMRQHTYLHAPIISGRIAKPQTRAESFHHLESHDHTQSFSELPSVYNTVSFVFSCSVSFLLAVYLNAWTPGQNNRLCFCVQPLVLCFPVLPAIHRLKRQPVTFVSYSSRSPGDFWGMTWPSVYIGHDGWPIQSAAALPLHST